jgi:mannose-6-phosphate isomerase-like protein (cupin superfamily)
MSMQAKVITTSPDQEYYTSERCHILELSNSSADEALSVARARVEPDVTTEWHSVDETDERYVILEGTGDVELEGQPPQRVGAGDVVLIPGGLQQRITNTGDSDLVFLALCTPRFRPEKYRSHE